MEKALTPEVKEALEAAHHRPSVSIIMPFQPRMKPRSELERSVKRVVDKIEMELMDNHPDVMGALVKDKLLELVKNLNYATHKNSIVIFISPFYQKIFYLDIEVEERIYIDNSFQIRELVYNKKQAQKYLLLLLNESESRIYVGDGNHLVNIVANRPADPNDIAEKVANFSDSQERQDILRNKFLQRIDNSLNIILQAYPLPFFIMGPEKMLGHFKKLTKHHQIVINYIQGDYVEMSPSLLQEKMRPFIKDWRKIQEKNLLNQLEIAAGKKMLAVGMREVWREAKEKNGRLLVIEKNYQYHPKDNTNTVDDVIFKAMGEYDKFSYKKGPIDDVIEKVVEIGGDVEFVEEGVLEKYQHIALVQFY